MVAFLSSRNVKGPWTLPPHLRVATILGNTEIDLRDAQFESETSVIELMTVLGNVEITVPPDVILESEGEPFLGNFEVHRQENVSNDPPPGAKRVRVIGKVYLGNGEITVKRRGQP